jgi:hypothetical protein
VVQPPQPARAIAPRMMDTSKVLYAPQILATIANLRVVDSGNACHRQRESMPLGAKFAPDHRKSSCLAESVDPERRV